MTLRLHNFFRSSTSTRLRAALNVKGLEYDYIAYVLRDGETRTPSYLSRNPQGLVPTLELEDGTNLTQSLAIIEYLEEICPAPTLLPTDPLGRARVRALSYMIACEIHPLNNLVTSSMPTKLPRKIGSPIGSKQHSMRWRQPCKALKRAAFAMAIRLAWRMCVCTRRSGTTSASAFRSKNGQPSHGYLPNFMGCRNLPMPRHPISPTLPKKIFGGERHG